MSKQLLHRPLHHTLLMLGVVILFFTLAGGVAALAADPPPPPTSAAAPVAPVAPAEESKEVKACATSQCHPGLMAKEPPLPKGHGDCVHCHLETSAGKGHPQTGANAFVLAKEICLECHGLVVDYDHLHPPVAAGDCQACHTLHSSTPGLTKAGRSPVLCYDCHQPVTREGDTQLHGDVGKQNCTSCHTVHGSFFPHLLAGPYSTEFFNDYDAKQYALCFQCHKIDLLLHPNTSYNTNFRDGKKNLHYLHVHRKNRGRSCKLCHAIHSSRLPKLMSEKVSFGDWEMPVNFVATENGGRCTPGCHAEAAYDRAKLSAPGLPGEAERLDRESFDEDAP